MNDLEHNGIVSRVGRYSVEETVQRLTSAFETKSIKLFAVIDHSGEAEKVGMKMPRTKLLIFGAPQAGTPLMLAAPSIAIDLPLKILVSEDNAGRVWLSYNRPSYLRKRHDVPEELMKNVAGIESLVAQLAE